MERKNKKKKIGNDGMGRNWRKKDRMNCFKLKQMCKNKKRIISLCLKNKREKKLLQMHKRKLLKVETKIAWNNKTNTPTRKQEAPCFYQWSNMMELEQKQHYDGTKIEQQDNGVGRWKNQDDKERQQKDVKRKGRKWCNIQSDF